MDFTIKFEQPNRKIRQSGKFATAAEAGQFKTDLLMEKLRKVDSSFWEMLRR